MRPHIDIRSEKLAAFCERWRVTELALFGSVLRDDFGPNSDVDVLVSFDEHAGHSLFDLDGMESELRRYLGAMPTLSAEKASKQAATTCAGTVF